MPNDPAPARPKRAYDPEGTRRRLLDVAAEAFQARGYEATSMHDVMRAAGATGGALYHHFPSKKALGLAVLEERVADSVADAWIAPVRSAVTAADGVRAAFETVAAGIEARGRVTGCPLGNLASELALADPAFRDAAEAVFAAWRAAIAARLRDEGAADPEVVATFVVAVYSGAMAQAKTAQSAAPLRQCAEMLDALLRERKRVA